MQIKYSYKGKDYATEWELRQAIWEQGRMELIEAPKENVAEFWKQFGVTYTETPTPLADLKAQKQMLLEQVFLSWYQQGAYLVSSLGFKADSDARAFADVDGLILTAQSGEAKNAIVFMDHDNVPHQVTADQLNTLKLEIAKNGQAAYQQKWQLRQVIEAAANQAALDKIEIVFTPTDFTKAAS